jgi:hypothetical protein
MPYIPDPQPHMARIWIKQAKYDIDAASGALEFVTDKSCNWVCVQCQQVSILMLGFMKVLTIIVRQLKLNIVALGKYIFGHRYDHWLAEC